MFYGQSVGELVLYAGSIILVIVILVADRVIIHKDNKQVGRIPK